MVETGSEAQFRLVIEAAPDGVVVSRSGVVLYANPSAVSLLGYANSAEIVGLPMSAFLDPAELTLMRERIAAMMRGGKRPAPQEYAARRRDGASITAEITSLPIEWDGGPAVIALVRDVTERARLQLELARTDRLRALGTLAAGVAHEVNNPLAYLMLSLESLEPLIRSAMEEEPRGVALKTLAEIRGAAERVSTTIRDLRAFAQDGEHAEPTRGGSDVAEVLETMRRLVTNSVSQRAKLTIEAPALRPVAASARRLEQVLVNLVLNAAHAVDGQVPSPFIHVRAFAVDERSVAIEVTDNGPGIAKDVISRIFDPFFTTKPAHLGSGLGLAISHRIVGEAGGTLTVESEVGQGTSFRVTLPVVPLQAMAPTPTPPPTPSGTGARWRVLVVDDEPAIGRMIQAVLDQHDVEVFSSGESALARLRDDHAFDVIVCDLMMPAVTGMDVFAAIATELPGVERRFVFATGGAFTARARSFLEAIPNERLDKPFTTVALEAALAVTVARTRRA